ncbi:MAG: hypothetical protein NC453_20350 [Muribaculum sp.]|nr:hypothetical protein [Muribaculum sp.]
MMKMLNGKNTMKKTIKHYINIITCILTIFCVSCDNSILDEGFQSLNEWNTCLLILDTYSLSRSESESTSFSLKNGDALAIRFSNDGKSTIGYAIYNAESEAWEAQYKGELVQASDQTCEVIYLGNQPSLKNNSTSVDLTPFVGIYSSKNGRYSFDGKNIHLVANLNGETARLKFIGTTASNFDIKGITYYKKFDLEKWEFANSEPYEDAIQVTTQNINGRYESDYMYVMLSKTSYNYEEDSRIWLKQDDKVYVYNTQLEGLLSSSKSGIIEVPSQSNHIGWNMDTYRKKTYSNLSVTSKSQSTDGWSQTQTSHKFSSTAGVHLTFDNILSTGWYSSSTDEEFKCRWDSDGSEASVFIDNDMWHLTSNKYTNNLRKGTTYHYSGMIYQPDATYYYFQFFTWRLTYKMTNITMSNF